jgi:hypothetical protein
MKVMDLVAVGVVAYVFFLVMFTIARGKYWLNRKQGHRKPDEKLPS